MVNSGWGKIVRDLRQGLSQDERYAVADHVVSQLEERGDPLGPRRGSKGPDADRPPRVPFSPFSRWGISAPVFRFCLSPGQANGRPQSSAGAFLSGGGQSSALHRADAYDFTLIERVELAAA